MCGKIWCLKGYISIIQDWTVRSWDTSEKRQKNNNKANPNEHHKSKDPKLCLEVA